MMEMHIGLGTRWRDGIGVAEIMWYCIAMDHKEMCVIVFKEKSEESSARNESTGTRRGWARKRNTRRIENTSKFFYMFFRTFST
jgi:hypothetical protein